MYETHQTEESLSFSPAACFSPCPSSAAPFHICLFLREQWSQKSVGVLLKLNLSLTNSLKSAVCCWEGWEGSLHSTRKNCWGMRKSRGGTNIFCPWDFWPSVARPSLSHHPLQPSTELPGLSAPSTDTPTADLQNLGTCTWQNHLNTDTPPPFKPPLDTQLLCNLKSNNIKYL